MCSKSCATPSSDVPTVAVQAFKGGVGKTTTVFNIGWYLSYCAKKRTLMVDLDSQCNLTEVFLCQSAHYDDMETITRVDYAHHRTEPNEPFRNVGEPLREVMEGNHELVARKSYALLAHEENPDLFLFPGSILLTSYEETLAAAETMRQPFTKHIPGALYHVIQRAARQCGAEIVVIDTSPSMGCLNMVTIMSSNFFFIPSQPDLFSLQGIKLLSKKCDAKTDKGWIRRMETLRAYTESSDHPLPKRNPLCLGWIIQMFTIRNQRPTKIFRSFIERISNALRTDLVPTLSALGMLVPTPPGEDSKPYVLAEMGNFNRFAPMAQDQGLPLLALHFGIGNLVRENTDGIVSLLTGKELDEARRDVAQKCARLIRIGDFIMHCVFGTDIPVPQETAVSPVVAPDELTRVEDEVVIKPDSSDGDMVVDSSSNIVSDSLSGDGASPHQKRKFLDTVDCDDDEVEQSPAKRQCSAIASSISADSVFSPNTAPKSMPVSISNCASLVTSISPEVLDSLPILSPPPIAAAAPALAQESAQTLVAATSVIDNSPTRPATLSLASPTPTAYNDNDYEDVVVCLSPRSALEIGCRMCWVERRLK